jgi:hypothetical protein
VLEVVCVFKRVILCSKDVVMGSKIVVCNGLWVVLDCL